MSKSEAFKIVCRHSMSVGDVAIIEGDLYREDSDEPLASHTDVSLGFSQAHCLELAKDLCILAGLDPERVQLKCIKSESTPYLITFLAIDTSRGED